jgi:hypothetical protein
MKIDLKKHNIPQFTIVEINWLDSVHGTGWHHLEDLTTDIKSIPHSTVGYCVHYDKDSIIVVQSKSTEKDHPSIDSTMQIPRCCIKSIRTL